LWKIRHRRAKIFEKIRKEQIQNFRESVTDGQRTPRKSVKNRYKSLENPSPTGKDFRENPQRTDTKFQRIRHRRSKMMKTPVKKRAQNPEAKGKKRQ
jgi:hypothetical protein